MKRITLVALGAAAVTTMVATLASAKVFTPWSAAVRVESLPGTDPSFNGPTLDGCPFVSPNGLNFYMASDRPGGLGGIDIWIARRESRNDPWGAPENAGAPVNSGYDDFCPSPTGKGFLYFVSSRPGFCGDADIFLTRRTATGWAEPRNLGCSVNSTAAEAGPYYLERKGHVFLYFSSTRAGGAPDTGPPDSDIYVSGMDKEGEFGAPGLAEGLNTALNDFRPNLRRDGLELFFDSNRPGGSGGVDLWTSTRASINGAWSTPTNLGPLVNSGANETRASLSRDAKTLYFGSNRPGSEPTAAGPPSSDHYVTTREQVKGGK